MKAHEKSGIRSSSRQRCRPVEFWNFEKPDYSNVQDISYNITLLTSRSNLSTLRVTNDKGSESAAANHRNTGKSKVAVQKIKPSKVVLKNVKRLKGKENAVPATPTANVASSTTGRRHLLPANKKEIKEGKEMSKLQGNEGKTQKKRAVKGKTLKEQTNTITTGEVSVNRKTGPSRKRSRIAVESSNDSGVTDMDDSGLQCMAGEVRVVEMSAEISNIHQDSQMQSKNTQLSSLSYISNHKAPNFSDILCSTAVNEDVLGPFNPSDNRGGTKRAFKVPLPAPRKLNKKNKMLEVVLDSIAEENESQNSGLQANVTTADVTPKKNNTLIKSRILNLTEDAEEVNQTKLKERRNRTKKPKMIFGAGDTTSDITQSSQQRNPLNDLETVRRSGRVRKKPLEYWNFEKAEVKTMNNGEVSVVYHKQIDPSETRKLSSTCGPVKVKGPPKHPALSQTDIKKLKAKRSLDAPLLKSSTGKKKMFSPKNNALDSTAAIPDLSPKNKRKSRSCKSTRTSVSAADMLNVDIDSLEFLPWVTRDFTCYMARSYCNKEAVVYAGFLFLEKGQMVWTSTKCTTLCVISGEGVLKILDSSDTGTLVFLEGKVKTVIPAGKKVSLEKEDSGDLLKFLIVLQNE